MSVLVVEDDRDLAFVWCEMLEQAGYDVIAASTVEEAVARANCDSIELVMLDLYLHGAPSLPVIDYVAMRHPAAPVVLITGTAMVSDTERMVLASKVDCVLRKPVGCSELRALLEYLLRAKQRVPGNAIEPSVRDAAISGTALL